MKKLQPCWRSRWKKLKKHKGLKTVSDSIGVCPKAPIKTGKG